MEVGPRRAIADLLQALDESVESRRRVTFSGREFVRRDEERRHLALRLEERKEPRGRNGRPGRGLKPAQDRRVSERSEPQRANCSPIRSGCDDETAGADPDQVANRTRTRSGLDQHIDPKEVFRREREDRLNLTPSLRGETMTIAQQDSKPDLRALSGAQRTRAIPFHACVRIGATENGGVGRGGGDPRRFLRSAECRAAERGGRARRIRVPQKLPPFPPDGRPGAPAGTAGGGPGGEGSPTPPGRLP